MSSVDNGRTSLDGHGIFAIVVFAIVALICIQPLRIPLPFFVSDRARYIRQKLVGGIAESRGDTTNAEAQRRRSQIRSHLTFNHVWTPAVGILFLLATKTIGGEQIKLGIVGEEGVEPYDVLALFISLAYIAISLDATGLLRYLAFQVCQKAGSNGYVLYFILYGFFWFLGVIVGNDPVILSGTAFLVHLTRVAGISPPSAWIWAQFVAANISSAVLVSSNPTNLVIATGFKITFPVYTAYMILPSFVSALVSLGLLLLFFRNKSKPDAKSRENALVAPIALLRGWSKRLTESQSSVQRRKGPHSSTQTNGNGAIEMSTMRGDANDRKAEEDERKTPLIHIPRSIIRPDVDARAALVDPKGAIFNSFVMAATLITLIVTSVTGHVRVYMIAAPGAGVCVIRDICYDWYTWRSTRKHNREKGDSENAPAAVQTDQGFADKVTQGETVNTLPKDAKPRKPYLSSFVALVELAQEVFPTVSYVFARLPFPLLPFAFGMFILVQSLAYVGFINIMASGIGKVCAGGAGACAVFMAVLSVILCNVSIHPSSMYLLILTFLCAARRNQYRRHNPLDKGNAVDCLSISTRSHTSSSPHQSGLLFRCLWIQYWRSRRYVCSQSSWSTMERCFTTARCSSDQDAISHVVCSRHRSCFTFWYWYSPCRSRAFQSITRSALPLNEVDMLPPFIFSFLGRGVLDRLDRKAEVLG